MSQFFIRHCAEGVLSFADSSNVVVELVTRVIDFTSRWVQSASRDIDITIASTIDPEWAMVHKPVFSSKALGHQLYTKAQPHKPLGKLVLCPQRCGVLVHSELNPKSTMVMFTCTKCEATCIIPYNKPRKTTPLNRRGLVKTVVMDMVIFRTILFELLVFEQLQPSFYNYWGNNPATFVIVQG